MMLETVERLSRVRLAISAREMEPSCLIRLSRMALFIWRMSAGSAAVALGGKGDRPDCRSAAYHTTTALCLSREQTKIRRNI